VARPPQLFSGMGAFQSRPFLAGIFKQLLTWLSPGGV
jgi:hypothetical protein